MKRLTAQETEKLVGMLEIAVNWDQLETFVHLGTGDRLFDEFVPDNLPLTPMLRKLTAGLELGPITDKFLRVVYGEKQHQTDLRTYIAELCPAIADASSRIPLSCEFQKAGSEGGAESAGPGLERLIRPALASPDTDIWLSRFEQLKRQVCRIEVNQSGIGTGFLVGPDAVLTNWHVIPLSVIVDSGVICCGSNGSGWVLPVLMGGHDERHTA